MDATELYPSAPLSEETTRKLDAYWRAANYLSVGQIYLLANPLPREPLRLAHIKPRLLGHWGTTPGLNFIYVHMNRAIQERKLDAMYIIGPGHGAPGIVANTYLGIEEWFDPGREMVVVGSLEEAVDRYRYLLSHENERLAMGLAARERVLKEHTFRHRARDLVEIVKGYL